MVIKEELISIIVPIYKVEQYLTKCIDSILEQTYTNLEIILVDDGSPDNCGKICDEYAKKDKRVIVLHNENKGVSASRNEGLDISKGKYITFIDADDYVSNNYVETLHKMIIANNADMAIIGNDEQYNGNIIKINKKLKKMIGKVETIKNILEEKYITAVCWGKIYRKELFENTRFDSNFTIGEDFKIMMSLLDKCQRINIDTTKNLYHYRLNKSSVTQQKERKDDWIKEIELSKKIMNMVENNYHNIKGQAIQRYIRVNITFIIRMMKEKDTDLKDEINQFKKNVKGYKFRYFFMTTANIKYKVKFILILWFPGVLLKLYE